MRVFTQEEKDILVRIRDGEGRNLYSLISPWIRGVSLEINTDTNSIIFTFEVIDNFDINERIKQIQTIIIQSVNIIKLFEDRGYFFTYVNSDQLPPNPFQFGEYTLDSSATTYQLPDPRISKMFIEYSTREIFITPELNKFIQDGFITREEVRANRQYTTTKRALKIAIIALIINILWNLYNLLDKESLLLWHNP